MKKYEISLEGFSESDYSSTTRMLTPRQHMFLDVLFDELMQGQGCDDYAPSISIREIKVRLDNYRKVDGTTIAYLDNAEDVKVGQVLTYVWNKKTKKFVVEEIRERRSKTMAVVLSPNDMVSYIPKNAELETDYKL